MDRIIDAQCPNGGWGYSYNNKINPDIDLSVTGWNVQALKAAEHGGIKPTKGEIRTALRKAASYCRKCGKPDGLFTYMQEARPARVWTGSRTTLKLSNGDRVPARKMSRATFTCTTTASRRP